jgi:hypothetical protein
MWWKCEKLNSKAPRISTTLLFWRKKHSKRWFYLQSFVYEKRVILRLCIFIQYNVCCSFSCSLVSLCLCFHVIVRFPFLLWKNKSRWRLFFEPFYNESFFINEWIILFATKRNVTVIEESVKNYLQTLVGNNFLLLYKQWNWSWQKLNKCNLYTFSPRVSFFDKSV